MGLTFIPEQNIVRIFELLFAWNSKWLLNFLLFDISYIGIIIQFKTMNRMAVKSFLNVSKFPNSQIQVLRRGYQCDGKVYGYNALAWKNKKDSVTCE